jgi:hypothetical protein
VTRLLDGRHHLERFAMEQAGEVDCLITGHHREGRVRRTGERHCTSPGFNLARTTLRWVASRRCQTETRSSAGPASRTYSTGPDTYAV